MTEAWNEQLADLRVNYDRGPLREDDLCRAPLDQFSQWIGEAISAGVPEPNAMTLATVGPDGAPSARTVLLKGADAGGFVFFTNRQSRKGREMADNPHVALVFVWLEIFRQVTVRGVVEQVSQEETAQYFRSRPHGSQVGAWASRQSTEVSREDLEARFAEIEGRFGDDVPVPDFWGGYRVRPSAIEFWQGQKSRMHDRLVFEAPSGTALDVDGWTVSRLSP